MRHFEQVVLVSEDGTKTIIERRYSTGELEYWSVLAIGVSDGERQGTAQVPFRITTPDSYTIHDGDSQSEEEFAAAMRLAEREAAFAAFDEAVRLAAPVAQAQVRAKVAEQRQRHQREDAKIVLANALPPQFRPN